jgi:hypothetical protein
MRDNINTGIHNTLRIEGDNNVIQQRIEKKDKTEIPVPSQGEVAPSRQPDLATKYSTIYEKPYQIPFSNFSPQMPERAIGVQMGQGTAVDDIRPLRTYVNPLRNQPVGSDKTAYNDLKNLLDGIDVPTIAQDFTQSYEKTGEPDTVIPTKSIPEPTGTFETDPLYPAQTEEEYAKADMKDSRFIIENTRNKRQELYGDDGFIRNLNLRTRQDRELYYRLTGVRWEERTPVQRQRARPIGEVIRERRQGRRPASAEDILMSPEQISQLPMESRDKLESAAKRLYFDT